MGRRVHGHTPHCFSLQTLNATPLSVDSTLLVTTQFTCITPELPIKSIKFPDFIINMLTTSTYTPVATEDSRLREEPLAAQTASSKMLLHPQSSSAQCRQPRLKKAHSEITWNYVIFAFTFFASLMAASAANDHEMCQSIYRNPLPCYHRRLVTKEEYEELPPYIEVTFTAEAELQGEDLKGIYQKTDTPPVWANNPAKKQVNFKGSKAYEADDTDSWKRHVGPNSKWYMREGDVNIVLFFNVIQKKWHFCGNDGLYYRGNNRGSMLPLPLDAWYFEEHPHSLSMYECTAPNKCQPIPNDKEQIKKGEAQIEKGKDPSELFMVQCHAPRCRYGDEKPAYGPYLKAPKGTNGRDHDKCVCDGMDDRSDMNHGKGCPNIGLPNDRGFRRVPKTVYAKGQGLAKKPANLPKIAHLTQQEAQIRMKTVVS